MGLEIKVSDSCEFGQAQALNVRRYGGPVWIRGLRTLSPQQAATIAGHEGELHLPDLVRVTRQVARRLAKHKGPLHLDGLTKASNDALRELAAHPNLWIPDDVNERLDLICGSYSDEMEDGKGKSEEYGRGDGERGDHIHHSEQSSADKETLRSMESGGQRHEPEVSHDEAGEGGVERRRVVMDDVVPKPQRGSEAMDALLRPLAQLVGLDEVKATIKSVVAMAHVGQQRRRAGLSVAPVSYHMAFFGPPGTGKTSVARLVAEILREAGVLSRGHLVETDGQGLVAKYLGQTGHRVRELVERSLGGVLFIDEAYSLSPREGSAGAYASEAIATLVPLLEIHREDLVVILAGYEEEMNELFAANPGLRSRFPHHMVFPAMDIEQLQAVYEHLAAEHGYLMSTQFKSAVRYAIDRERRIRGRRFANARAVRTLFEATLAKQAERLAASPGPSVIELQTLLLEDLPDQLA
jgi:ATP-dependent Clp protease ATP-binding subunit ClpA